MSKAARRTLAGQTTLEGTGLHTGERARVTLKPAPAGSGIRFVRVDLDEPVSIPATVDQVSGVDWETALGNGQASIRTVEHVLAAIAAAGIDDIAVEVDGPEPPALDGSAAAWSDALEEAGFDAQDGAPRTVAVSHPIHLRHGESRYSVVPHDGYRVSATIDFDHPAIGSQFASFPIDPAVFREQLAPARTFGLEAWADDLRARGLAQGASLENTVVVGEEALAAGSELRFPDEFVRHKILDLVGDLALVGAHIQAHVIAERPGHAGNVALARRLASRVGMDGGKPAFGIDRILEYLPHRYPMLLVDRILEFEDRKRIVGIKNVTINEPFFAGHFPDHPIMPGVLIVEAMAQCGGLLLMNAFDDPTGKVVYFMSLDAVKFRRPVLPGDQLEFELEMLQFRGRICKMAGVARVDGQVATEATMMAQVVDR